MCVEYKWGSNEFSEKVGFGLHWNWKSSGIILTWVPGLYSKSQAKKIDISATWKNQVISIF